jgi:hypothetical protein
MEPMEKLEKITALVAASTAFVWSIVALIHLWK